MLSKFYYFLDIPCIIFMWWHVYMSSSLLALKTMEISNFICRYWINVYAYGSYSECELKIFMFNRAKTKLSESLTNG